MVDKRIVWTFLSLGIIGLIYACWVTTDDELDDSEDDSQNTKSKGCNISEPFIPTHEWQEVKEGQAVPPGLSIRFDFKTGKNYAKLLDEEKKPDNVVHVDSTSFM